MSQPFSLFFPSATVVMYDGEWSPQGFSCFLLFFSNYLPAFADEEQHQRKRCFLPPGFYWE